ncbi:MAG: alpha-amylase/4-alpha-glucanotransferase domain-containing protein [Candidatus Kryptonium sp.]
MKKINLVLGIHNHQPVGNFDFVFEHAYEVAYKPFIKILAKYPKIKLAQHYTGILFQWILKNHPEFFDDLKALVDRGQVELITGGFYEPILAIIPDQDKLDQIKKLSDFIIKHFNKTPVGMWLAERVWEQHIVKFIAMAGVKYVIIDDTHFRYAGLTGEKLLGYYITEEQGYTVNIFPISKMLRYTIPFQPVEKTIDYLREIATQEGDRIVVYADDGEKFGVWPNTYKHVYEDGWLEEFFTALEENSDWINILHFSEVIERIKPIGRIYLPNASYAEMMHWALPADAYLDYEKLEEHLKEEGMYEQYSRFFRGGFWRNFLVKYPEANNLHKKMLRVSERARKLQAKGKDVDIALDKIWSAQCNDPYWHGIFGGLYLTNLRSTAYRNLISAENELDKIEGKKLIRYEFTDFDRDGRDELIVESPNFNIYINPNYGGQIFELDFKPAEFNITDVITRRKEGYHEKLLQLANEQNNPNNHGVASIHDMLLTKEEGLEKLLHYDWYRRGSLIDHFLGDGTTLENFYQSKYPEQGDFVDQPYHVETNFKKSALEIILSRQGNVWIENERKKVRVEKRITINKNATDLFIDYKIENLEDEMLDLWFGVEFVCNFLAPDSGDRYFYFVGYEVEDKKLRSIGSVDDVVSFGIVDEWLGLDMNFYLSKFANVWRFPLESVSLSEAGFERVYQGSVILLNWNIKLSKEWTVQIHKSFRRLKN